MRFEQYFFNDKLINDIFKFYSSKTFMYLFIYMWKIMYYVGIQLWNKEICYIYITQNIIKCNLESVYTNIRIIQ